ncbi:MAG: hypothetical protein A2Y04_02440 [Omnitrophica WOR_2 bacterium GWC2_45_7]|nr:MAG: hypothetical protein A2Y04_02440 [Omnitrophica WOR_2 bacterium GWC2_45_7]
MHPIAALPRGEETNVFLNFDSNITDRTKFSRQFFDKERGIKFYWNCLNEFDFARIFARTGKVLTNSYHVAYWSLISGRDVAIIGYSSKFRSLLKLTGLRKETLVEYDVKDQEKLLALIRDVIRQDRFYRLNAFDEARNEFIRKNIDFAKECKDIGFVQDVSIRPFQRWRSLCRKLNYDFFETLVRMSKKMRRP